MRVGSMFAMFAVLAIVLLGLYAMVGYEFAKTADVLHNLDYADVPTIARMQAAESAMAYADALHRRNTWHMTVRIGLCITGGLAALAIGSRWPRRPYVVRLDDTQLARWQDMQQRQTQYRDWA